ncbi:4a-hydroxytetrahydrobiopterin dehydratase [Allobranchiibius sp. GilTou73]|uniref:4a-hydroxytetrahydrobiopterin dehydratase n=1 Tax=Allobranchiibius sp. GilTou73 TaxID=2904523 RepID=UPI001F35BE90|nr:4a-hydroxytetrahydrobiopterin dehydratase [Allobranchiibius sp. GilTou73]UIJ34771.1 4a-hydroxytetrahydrobiopterin dehydratase [Allobranchiibius sp. GilTou73]
MNDNTETQPDPKHTLTEGEVEREGLPDWRMLIDRLHASFDTGDFVTAVGLVDAIGRVAEEMDHHPDLDLAYGRLDVRLISHDVDGVTSRDVAVARAISESARAAGATPHPERTSVLELALDSADEAEIRPFWAALLDYDTVQAWGEIQLHDATGRRASIWFQPTEAHDVPRQRWHLDLRIPPEVVHDRIAAAIEAGGELVDDTAAPAFWVLADPQGNRACLTTWQGRE